MIFCCLQVFFLICPGWLMGRRAIHVKINPCSNMIRTGTLFREDSHFHQACSIPIVITLTTDKRSRYD